MPEFVGTGQIVLGLALRTSPAWLSVAAFLGVSIAWRERLGLYGQALETHGGIAGIAICLFWVFTALFSSIIAPFDPLAQFPAMKDALPGAIEPGSGEVFLFGGDKLARDVFSRMVHGSRIVLIIAPAATAFALIVGVMLGLAAGYHGGRVDTVLSFLANLVLAFPVILLFYLLVTPGIMGTALPYSVAGLILLFPLLFFWTLFYTGYKHRPTLFAVQAGLTLLVGAWVYVGLVLNADPLGVISVRPNELNIFVAVVFASAPGVFRIVRGLAMDIKTREYVAAAQTRGESPWYVMLWEMLPNAREPLIVDACLRIGYTTILLGTLGYFGLGLAPESPDWGTAIKDAGRLLRSHIHPALPPTLALTSFVLGLNLLADALREASLRD